MAISDTITSMYENVGNVYDVLELAGADLTNVDKNIFNLKQSWEERLLYFLANGTDVVWNNWEKVTGTGETITLNNTIEAKMDFVYKGNTYQYSTSGKNKSHFNRISLNGITFEGNDIDILNPTSYVYASEQWNLRNNSALSGKTYTIYLLINGTKESGKWFSINIGKTGSSYAFQYSFASATTTYNNVVSVGTITLGENEVFTSISCYLGSSLTANINVKFMVVEGSYTAQTIGDYEPYTNGASPNPDYPQDIQVVSGDNTIKVEGKNLCNGITQNYFVNQAAIRCGYTVGNSGLIIEVDGVSDYTISSNTVQTRYRVGCLNEIPVEEGSNTIVYNGLNKDGTDDSVSINTNGYKYLVVNATDLTSIQIEKESSASEFQPYQSQSYTVNLGSIELCKIGDYQDYIYKENNKWYKHSEIGKGVINGTENWNYQSQFPRFTVAGYSGDKLKTDSSDYVSHYIKGQTADTNNTLNVWANDSNKQVLVHDERFTTKEAFNNWLSTNNVTFYGLLYTPTNTEITDTTLISQLEAIKKSYNTQTNISQTNADKPFILDVTALGN